MAPDLARGGEGIEEGQGPASGGCCAVSPMYSTVGGASWCLPLSSKAANVQDKEAALTSFTHTDLLYLYTLGPEEGFASSEPSWLGKVLPISHGSEALSMSTIHIHLRLRLLPKVCK